MGTGYQNVSLINWLKTGLSAPLWWTDTNLQTAGFKFDISGCGLNYWAQDISQCHALVNV